MLDSTSLHPRITLDPYRSIPFSFGPSNFFITTPCSRAPLLLSSPHHFSTFDHPCITFHHPLSPFTSSDHSLIAVFFMTFLLPCYHLFIGTNPTPRATPPHLPHHPMLLHPHPTPLYTVTPQPTSHPHLHSAPPLTPSHPFHPHPKKQSTNLSFQDAFCLSSAPPKRTRYFVNRLGGRFTEKQAPFC